MTYKKLQIVSFLVFLLAVFILALWIVKPFLNVLAFSVIIAVLFWPLYQRIRTRFSSETIASLLTLVIIMLIVLVPLWILGQLIFNEASGVYQQYRSGSLTISDDGVLRHFSPNMQETVRGIIEQIKGAVNDFTNNAFQTVSSLLSNVINFFLAAFLFFFSIFFVLRDGDKLKRIIMDISPIAQEQEDVLFRKVGNAVNGVVKGAFLMALIQGAMATLGFLIFGVPNPVLWGMFTVLAALVPTVGTAIALVPAVIYLFLAGHVGAGVGLAIWGAVAVGLIDNIIGPKLIGYKAKLHPLLVFISVLGGVQLFGFVGFLLGPIIMAIFVALIDIYRTDFKAYLEN